MMMLDPTLDNNLGENWIAADVVFGDGDYGTPGEINYGGDCGTGDMNGDGDYNVLDVVVLVNCVLADTCDCTNDLNGDGAYNVLDVVALVNCVLADNCEL